MMDCSHLVSLGALIEALVLVDWLAGGGGQHSALY